MHSFSYASKYIDMSRYMVKVTWNSHFGPSTIAVCSVSFSNYQNDHFSPEIYLLYQFHP